jgi:hypothetical protein
MLRARAAPGGLARSAAPTLANSRPDIRTHKCVPAGKESTALGAGGRARKFHAAARLDCKALAFAAGRTNDEGTVNRKHGKPQMYLFGHTDPADVVSIVLDSGRQADCLLAPQLRSFAAGAERARDIRPPN